MRWGFLVGIAAVICHAVDGTAQVPAPLPDPNLPLLTNGPVSAVVRLGDGSVVIGGSFTSVNGEPRSNLAKLLPNGTLDAAWNPAPNGDVHALATDGNGNLYVGGTFSFVGGQSLPNLAKISGNTGVTDGTWGPAPNGDVTALAVDGGNVYVGGNFASIGGQGREFIAKLSGVGTGTADATWNPAANGRVVALAVDGGGNVYAGGSFTSIGGGNRNHIAKLSGSGTGAADAPWNPSPTDGSVLALAADGNGSVFVGGSFTAIGGQTRPYIAKLSSSGGGGADASWEALANGVVNAVGVDANGNVIAGGDFTSIGGQVRRRIARLSGSGAGDADSWNPSANKSVMAVSVDGSGNVAVGGIFTAIGTSQCSGFAVVNAAGVATISAETAVAKGRVLALVRQPGGGVIVGGDFFKAGSALRDNLLRLRADGTLDPDWNPAPNGIVMALAAETGGDVYAGGSFTSVGGQDRNRIAKLSGSGAGAADVTWNPSADNAVSALSVDAGGNVYAGGWFSNIGGRSRKAIAKLSGGGAGAADSIWNPGMNFGTQQIYALALDGSGNIYVGGFLTAIGGQNRMAIAKLSGSGAGTADANWNPSPGTGTLNFPTVSALAVDGAGNVYAGGYFTSIGGKFRNRIAKLSGSGTGAADPTWNPAANGNRVSALAVDGDGNVYAGGDFSNIGGLDRSRIARLSGSGTGAADAIWNPNAMWSNFLFPSVFALALDGSGHLYVGGDFLTMGNQDRGGLAAVPLDADRIFANGFE